MGLIDDFCDFVCDVAGAVVDTCCEVVSGVASAFCSAIEAGFDLAVKLCKEALNKAVLGLLTPLVSIITGVLGPVLGPLVAKWVLEQIENVLVKMLFGDEKEKADKMGYRLEEAKEHSDWKQADDFESFEKFYEYLQEQIPDEKIDQEKLKEKKYYYEAIAVERMAEEIGKKYGVDMQPDFLVEIGRSAMEEKEVEAIIAAYKSLGYDNVAISDYLKGTLSQEEYKKVREALIASLKSAYPLKSEADLIGRLDIMKLCSKDDKFMAENSYGYALNDIIEKRENSIYLR